MLKAMWTGVKFMIGMILALILLCIIGLATGSGVYWFATSIAGVDTIGGQVVSGLVAILVTLIVLGAFCGAMDYMGAKK